MTWIEVVMKYLPQAISLSPQVIQMIQAIAALRQTYPQLTDAQITELVVALTTEADSAYDRVIADTRS